MLLPGSPSLLHLLRTPPLHGIVERDYIGISARSHMQEGASSVKKPAVPPKVARVGVISLSHFSRPGLIGSPGH